MPQCAFHPNVETNVRCTECERPICPKDFVTTPVGYKCKECARQLPSARHVVKPKQLALAAAAAIAVGVGGAFLIALTGFTFWYAAVLLGVLTGEAARRASGGHRGAAVATVAGTAALTGTYFAGFGVDASAIALVAAAASVVWMRW